MTMSQRKKFNGKMGSRSSSTVSLASTSSRSSNSQDSHKTLPGFVNEMQLQMSRMRTNCALLAAAYYQEQCEIESKKDEEILKEVTATMDLLRKLGEVKTLIGQPTEDLPDLESKLRKLESILDSIEVLKPLLTLSEFSPAAASELSKIFSMIQDCNQTVADFKRESSGSGTDEIVQLTLRTKALTSEIADGLKKIENLNGLKEVLRLYAESMEITKAVRRKRPETPPREERC